MSISSESLFIRSRPIQLGWSRSALTGICVFLVAFFSWANWAVLEEQVRTTGKIVVSSRSQVVQVVDGGVLTSLNVREGQTVTEGQLLAKLDEARFAASAAETKAKSYSLLANIQRLQAEIDGEPLQFSSGLLTDTALIEGQRALHKRRLKQQKEHQESLRQSLRLAVQERDSMEDLSTTGDASQSDLIRVRREVVKLQSELTNTRNEYLREAQSELSAAQAEYEQTIQILKQREEALNATRIYAPMSGQVKNIGVTTIGAVLRAGEELMQIVPSEEPLLIEAKVYSKDIAFIRENLNVNIKLDAYDFTVYGGLKGTVEYISPDTIDTDLAEDEPPYYKVLVRLDKLAARQSGKFDLIPGMTTTVEIITGEKSVLEYLLKPLKRGASSAFTER